MVRVRARGLGSGSGLGLRASRGGFSFLKSADPDHDPDHDHDHDPDHDSELCCSELGLAASRCVDVCSFPQSMR